MAADTTVEGVYAEALLQIGQEKGILEELREELSQLVPALIEDPRIFDFLRTPNIAREDKVAAIKKAVGSKISEPVINFLRAVFRRDRQAHLGAIYDDFLERYQRAQNVLVVEVTTAQKLNDGQRGKLTASLEKRYGRKVVLREHVEAALIGGIQIQAEGDFVDATLKSRLQEAGGRLNYGKLKGGDYYED